LEVDKFDNMGLKESVLRGIYGYGFKDPSPIQCKGILPLIQGKDTIA
jgi:translation initiation factor 4A